jgi:hypothetical protein
MTSVYGFARRAGAARFSLTRRTLKWFKVKVPHYREGERGWEPKSGQGVP